MIRRKEVLNDKIFEEFLTKAVTEMKTVNEQKVVNVHEGVEQKNLKIKDDY